MFLCLRLSVYLRLRCAIHQLDRTLKIILNELRLNYNLTRIIHQWTIYVVVHAILLQQRELNTMIYVIVVDKFGGT